MDIKGMLRDAHVERADLQKRLRAVDTLIAALEGLLGDAPEVIPAPESPVDTYPKPREAVMRAVRELTVGRPVEPKHVTEIVRKLGLFNPGLKSGATAYTTALSRLADKPKSGVHRQGDFYVFLPNSGEVTNDGQVSHDDN